MQLPSSRSHSGAFYYRTQQPSTKRVPVAHVMVGSGDTDADTINADHTAHRRPGRITSRTGVEAGLRARYRALRRCRPRNREVLMIVGIGGVVKLGPLSSPLGARPRSQLGIPQYPVQEVGADIPTMICGCSVDANRLPPLIAVDCCHQITFPVVRRYFCTSERTLANGRHDAI